MNNGDSRPLIALFPEVLTVYTGVLSDLGPGALEL